MKSQQWELAKDRVYVSFMFNPEWMLDLSFHLCTSEFSFHCTLFGLWIGFDAFWGKESSSVGPSSEG